MEAVHIVHFAADTTRGLREEGDMFANRFSIIFSQSFFFFCCWLEKEVMKM